MRKFDVVIVGMGHAGAQAAISLRSLKFKGSIAMIGDEPELPYERPPLSKEYFSGDKTFDRILIRKSAYWDEQDITMFSGTRVVSLDPAAHNVTTDRGERIGYGRLIWATGGTARRPACPGNDLAGIHSVRTRADVDRLNNEVQSVEEVVVIGGGYIGLESAAVLAKMGKKVTVIEAQDRVLARVAGETLSRFYEAEHRAHGVDIRLCAMLESFEGEDGRVTGARLADGAFIPAQLAIVGIGIEPAVAPLLAVGAHGGNGVMIDEYGATTLPDVFAIGDCAMHPNPYAGYQMLRLESVQNATDQAAIVAGVIAGIEEKYDRVPWFWSNQYDLRLQTAGLSLGYDYTVIRGDISSRSFSVIYFIGDRVVALDCVNATKDYVQGKTLVAERVVVDPHVLADPNVSLKSFAGGQAAAA